MATKTLTNDDFAKMDIKQLQEQLGTSAEGLSHDEAANGSHNTEPIPFSMANVSRSY